MKIGMSLTSSYSIGRDSTVIMENLTEEVKLMADLGFDSFSLGDHHLTSDHYVQVLPAISSLSSISGNMQLLPLFLLPFYNPILLAEQLATLDVISGGRTAVINALGYDPAAFTAFGTTQRARVSRFVETFEIMRLLWGQEPDRGSARRAGRAGTSRAGAVPLAAGAHRRSAAARPPEPAANAGARRSGRRSPDGRGWPRRRLRQAPG